MGGGIVAIEVGIDRVLIFVALLILGLDAIFVEGALKEDVFNAEAGHLERRTGLHPDLISGGSQHVGRGHDAGGIETLTVAVDLTTRLAERLKGDAQFVG